MKVVLTGASGQLGAYLNDGLRSGGHEVRAWSGTERGERGGFPFEPIDLSNGDEAERALDRADPDAVIHAAALSSAEAVRLDPARAAAINVEATARIARWCGRLDRKLVFTSTDLVFDGSRPWNREDDPAGPILAYGRTKRDAEPAVLAASRGIVARVSLLYGPSRCGRPSFFDQAIRALRAGEPRAFFEDEYRTPLDLGGAAKALILLAERGEPGLYHVAGIDRISRFDLMRRAALCLGIDPALVRPSRRADAASPEPRPADVSLDTTRLARAFPDLRRSSIEEALTSD